MIHQQFVSLCGYSKARKFAPKYHGMSRKTAKKGPVQVLKNSRVVSEVPLEKLFPKRVNSF